MDLFPHYCSLNRQILTMNKNCYLFYKVNYVRLATVYFSKFVINTRITLWKISNLELKISDLNFQSFTDLKKFGNCTLSQWTSLALGTAALKQKIKWQILKLSHEHKEQWGNLIQRIGRFQDELLHQCYQTILAQCSTSIPSENFRLPSAFWRVQGV